MQSMLFWAFNTPIQNLVVNGMLIIVAIGIAGHTAPDILDAVKDFMKISMKFILALKQALIQSLSDYVDELCDRYGKLPERRIRIPERGLRITRDTKIS